MMRMLDGKRMLAELDMSDSRWALASWIRQLDCVPIEWQEVVKRATGEIL